MISARTIAPRSTNIFLYQRDTRANRIKLNKSVFLEKTLVKFTRYSNQFIKLYIHITYSSLQVIKPTYYCRHWSYTSDSASDIKNPWARRSFIPLIVGINDKYREFTSFGGMPPKSPKVDIQKFPKTYLYLIGCSIKSLCHSIGAKHKK